MGKYKTFGSRFDRVHRNDLNANFAAVEADINAQKSRVDDLITGTPQPSEVVDARGGFPVLSGRLDDLSSSLAQIAYFLKGLVSGQDNTAKLNSEIANAKSKGSNYIVLPEGDYWINSDIMIPSNTTLIGENYNATLRIKAANINGLNLTSVNNVNLKGIHIIGDYGAGTNFNEKNNGIFCKNVKNVNISHCLVEYISGAGIYVNNYTNVTIENNILQNNRYDDGQSTDIILYSLTLGQEARIVGNKCYSDNSQNIYVNAISLDKDIFITENICVTKNVDGSEKTNGMSKRHGIVISYNGINNQRTIVSKNIVRNSNWTGIYHNQNTYPTDKNTATNVIISENICENVAQKDPATDATNNSLFGGIWIGAGATNCVVSRNRIINTGKNPGIKINAYYGSLISENIIQQSEIGIYLYNTCFSSKVINNTIFNSTNNDIKLLNATHANPINIEIKHNKIERTNALFSSVTLSHFSSSDDIILILDGNTIYGTDIATQNDQNTGIYVSKKYFILTNNVIKNFFYGINCKDLDLSHGVDGFKDFTKYVLKNNNCTVNTFIKTNAFNKGYFLAQFNELSVTVFVETVNRLIIRNGYRIGLNTIIYDTAIPTVGTWSIGDRIINSNPVIGQPKSWICTVAGTPGTWTSEGNL
jgi:hypothetical protein